MRLLLLGATGLVGSNVLEQATPEKGFTAVIAPTRTPLEPRPGLSNPVSSRVEQLASQLPSWQIDAVICALGTTKAKAGSPEAFRHIDYALPLIFGRAAKGAGVRTFAVVSAIGASATSSFSYARTKGEMERDLQDVGFDSLTICRPSMIAGERAESRVAEGVALAASRILAPILPKKFHVNPASVIADSLLRAVTEAKPGCRWIFAEEMN